MTVIEEMTGDRIGDDPSHRTALIGQLPSDLCWNRVASC